MDCFGRHWVVRYLRLKTSAETTWANSALRITRFTSEVGKRASKQTGENKKGSVGFEGEVEDSGNISPICLTAE